MKEVSTSTKGMNKDTVDLYQGADNYSYAMNAVVENETGDGLILQNEASNLLGVRFEENEKVVGYIFLPELEITLLFTDKNKIHKVSIINFSDEYGNIGGIEGSTESVPLEDRVQLEVMSSEIVAESECFNWTTKNKLSIKHKITNNNLKLYFVDGVNEDRYIYFNLKNKILTINDQFLNGNKIDCNSLKWNPNVDYPEITTIEVSGGNLLSGVYQFFVAYTTSKGVALSSYKGGTNPIHINSKVEIDRLDYETNKAIYIDVKSLNTVNTYKYISIVALATVGGISTYKIIKTLNISDKMSLTYTKHEGLDIGETQLFQVFPFYKNSERLTKANNKLLKAKLKEFEKINIQRIASKIILKWFTITAKEGDYLNSSFAQNYRGYLRDEIYTYGIKLIFTNGEETHVGHIPARVKNRFDLASQNTNKLNKDVFHTNTDCKPDEDVLKWQVYNTAKVGFKLASKYNKCDYQEYSEGSFAYWESSENYPNDLDIWGTLANTPIRHHKFPDCLVSPLQDGTTLNFKSFDDDNLIYPIGVKLDEGLSIETILQESVNEKLITQEQKDRIVGYKILRGNRASNKSIDAKGLLYDMFNYEENNTTYYYANYPFNDLRADPYLSHLKVDDSEARIRNFATNILENFPNNFFQKGKYTFHSPDTHFNQPEIGNILKLETEVYGEARGFFNRSQDYAKYKLLSEEQYLFAIMMGTLLGNMLEYSEPGASGAAQSIGQTAGGAIGTFAGGPVGAALGSTLGGIVGGIIDDNNDKPFEKMYKNVMVLSQSEKLINLFKLSANYENYHWQYQAIGKYSNTKEVLNTGNKQRLINNYSYLSSSRQTLGNTFINNYKRESSLYLEINDLISSPTVQDNSRFLVSQTQEGCGYLENQQLKSTISSYYASLKRNISNQYGSVYDIKYIPVSGKVWKLNEQFKEFGGDTYINRFALKRKQTFFTQDAYSLPNDTDIFYEDYSNMGRVRYYFNTQNTQQGNYDLSGRGLLAVFLQDLDQAKAVLQQILVDLNRWITSRRTRLFNNAVILELSDLLGNTLLNPFIQLRPPEHRLDCEIGNYKQNKLSTRSLGGKVYTHSTGIPYFICESDVNVDLRHARDSQEKNFYPNQTDIGFWLQEKNVSYTIDNFYGYNRDFSKQNKEDISILADSNFYKQKDNTEHKNRVIYSLDGIEVDDILYRDNYLYYKPLDAFDFSYENGELISVDSIEGERVLVRFENNTRIFNAFDQLRTENGIVSLGNGALFGGRPQEYSKTDLGYFGSQHDNILHTEFGHITVDAKRGQVFLLKTGGGIEEISIKLMKNWFLENLPFQINKYFDVNNNNTYDGAGITMCYDNRYKRLLLTKLDYIPLVKGIEYLDDFYFEGKKIYLNDKKYFEDISWTVSYNFMSQSWRSFHSYTPNYYIGNLDTFYSGINDTNSIWIHNLTNKSYQVFYGVLYPFIVEAVTKPSLTTSILQCAEFYLDTYRFHNKQDIAQRNEISFNKALIHNRDQNTGLLELNLIDENNLYEKTKYPKEFMDHTKISLSYKENIFSFNQFTNKKKNNLPSIITEKDGVSEYVNKSSIDYTSLKIGNDYMRSNIHKIRLINDKYSNFKFIFKGLISDTLNSIR